MGKEDKDTAFNIEETGKDLKDLQPSSGAEVDPALTTLLSQMKSAKLQATGNSEILFSNRVYDPGKDERM